MHIREYMDYHSSRFTDSSLIAYSGNKIVALLPANCVGNTLYSHQGLTFAGWLTPANHFDVSDMLQIFDAMNTFLPSIGINELIYKAIPHIYHTYPAEEDLYAIFRHNGRLVASNISATISMESPLRFNENSRRAIKFATEQGVTVQETADLAHYWSILTEMLHTRHSTDPVHSLAEIELLKSKFSQNIRLFTASLNDRVLGGVLIYLSKNIAHAQYIAASPEGREKKVLPLIFQHLISNVFTSCRYFDFGTSNEQNGIYLNSGLSMQKTGMGGRGIVYNIYSLKFK